MRRASKDVEAIFREGKPIDDALRRAVRQALRRHKLLGESVASYESGRVVIVPPEQILVDGDEPDAPLDPPAAGAPR